MRLLALLAALYPAVVPHSWRAPSYWLQGALCIHRHEATWTASTGNGYHGGFQFLLSTWASVGGPGLPENQSPREQLYRAWLVWNRDGQSWEEWPTRWACGLH